MQPPPGWHLCGILAGSSAPDKLAFAPACGCRRSPRRALQASRNLVHASANLTNAPTEIQLWFPAGVTEWVLPTAPWIYGA
jgi:hypothetical protein